MLVVDALARPTASIVGHFGRAPTTTVPQLHRLQFRDEVVEILFCVLLQPWVVNTPLSPRALLIQDSSNLTPAKRTLESALEESDQERVFLLPLNCRGGLSPVSMEKDLVLKKVPSGKLKTNRRVHARKNLEYSAIQKQLQLFQKCCVASCYTWLTIAIVMNCRTQFLGIPDYNDRRTWLHKEMDEMGICPDFPNNYSIDIFGEKRRRSCGKAWRFCNGIQESWQARTACGNTPTLLKNRGCCIKDRIS